MSVECTDSSVESVEAGRQRFIVCIKGEGKDQDELITIRELTPEEAAKISCAAPEEKVNALETVVDDVRKRFPIADIVVSVE